MKAVFTRFFSVLKANTPPCKKGLSSLKFLSLFLILFLAVGNAWGQETVIYSTDVKETPNSPATATTGKASYSTTSVDWASAYSNFLKTTGSDGYYQLDFNSVIDLTAYVDVKIKIYWGATSNRPLNITINGGTAEKIDAVTTSSDRSKVREVETELSVNSLTSIKFNSSGGGNVFLFRIEIVGTSTSSGGGDSVCPETLTITSKDSKTAFLEGDAIELTAALSEGNGAITYQWYKGGTAEGNKLAGKTAAKLEIASCAEGDAGDYYCVASKSDCSDAVNADAFTITVAHNPCAMYFWFFNDADQTANGKTNATSVFSSMASGNSNMNGSITIDEVTYNVTRRSGDADLLGRFTVPANKAATFYTLAVSSGNGARKIVLTNTTTSATYEADVAGGDTSYKRVQIDNIAPGTYSIGKSGGNTRLGMVALKVCDAVFHTVTFNSNGGSAVADLSVLDGTTAIQPTDPTWEHHRFDGWYNGETAYDWTANVTGDLTLTAHWTQLYTITYAAGDGTATGDAPTQVDKAEGETFTVAANTFEVAGKDFVKWNDGTNDYAPGATYTVGTDNVVLTAQWKAAADKYTVKFMDGTTELGTKLFDVTTNPSDADIDKTKALNTFAAWQKEGVDIALDDAFWATVAKDAEITLTARWAAAYASNVNFKEAETQALGVETALNTYHYASDAGDISFEEKGLKIKTNAARFYFNVAPGKVAEIKFGNISGATYSVDGGAAETLTSSQLKATYSASAQSCVMTMTTAAYNIVEKVTIHDPFSVTFDANGGDPVAAQFGEPSVTLPLPTKGTESFLGWFDGETKVGEAGDKYTPAANITLKAHWEAISTDARLASISFSAVGILAPEFNPEVTNYTYTMPYGTAAVPTITGATSVSAKAQEPQIVSQASAWGETAVIRGVAESSDTKAYNITMLRAPKDGACIFKAELTSATAAEYSGIYADATNSKINLSNDGDNGYKFAGKSNYIQMALTGGTFAEGDILHMTYKKAPQQGELAIYNNTTKIVGTAYTNSTLEFPVGAAGLSTLYIRRTEDNTFNGWISVVEVTRIVNPMLTAITFDGVAGVIDEDNKKVTVELPFSSNVASMVVKPTIAWNTPAATNPIVVNDGSDWVVGDNTYVLTDKDGDQTTYTITLTQALPSADATLKTLTINGNALTLVDGVYEYDYELPYGTNTAPVVVAEANDANATAVVTSVLLTEAVITVTAENGATQEYVINFTVSPWQNIVIWDGSTMDAVAASPDASGLTWEVNGFKSIAGYTTTCGSKTYSKVLPSGGSASDSRNFKIVIPDGYLAKFYIAFASHEDGNLRGMSIGTTINKNSDTSIYGAECSTRSEALGGTSVIVGAGTYYINPIASIDFCEVSVLLRPGYIRTGLTVGSLGTICLPSNVPAGQAFGATFYKLEGKEPQYGKIVFEEEKDELEAGKPYLFQANAAEIVCYYGTTSVSSPDNSGAMKGTFVDLELTELSNIYYFAQKALWSCVDLTSLSVPANRAYVDMDEMPAISESNPAPGVRRITLGVNGQNTATGVENIGTSEQPMKMIIDGQLYIIRGEKTYDAQGKLVK